MEPGLYVKYDGDTDWRRICDVESLAFTPRQSVDNQPMSNSEVTIGTGAAVLKVVLADGRR